jgi:hypothetical protein
MDQFAAYFAIDPSTVGNIVHHAEEGDCNGESNQRCDVEVHVFVLRDVLSIKTKGRVSVRHNHRQKSAIHNREIFTRNFNRTLGATDPSLP